MRGEAQSTYLDVCSHASAPTPPEMTTRARFDRVAFYDKMLACMIRLEAMHAPGLDKMEPHENGVKPFSGVGRHLSQCRHASP